jgi:integrase
MQRGHIFRKGNVWYGRWRRAEIVKDADGNSRTERRQHCEKLADFSDRYRTETDVQPLLDAKLASLNEGRESPESTLSVCEYAEKHFLPWADGELRPATAHGYRALWKSYLRPRVQKITVRDFRCCEATRLLSDLHREHGLGRATLAHVKGLLGVIFTHARRAGVLDGTNPVREAGIPRAASAGEPTHAYTPQEITTMLDALEGTAKTAIAVMFFAGLRPSEARGLQWTDYNAKAKTLRVSRSMWRSFTNEPKTESSVACVPVPQVLADVLEAVPRTSEYILTSALGKPVDLHNLASRVIRPALAKCATCRKAKHPVNGHEYQPFGSWRGFYALRRGCATLATSLDSPLAAKSLLRHSNVQTTAQYYIKSVADDAVRASQKMNALFEHRDSEVCN